MGGYQPGSDAELDQAILLVPRIYEIMTQSPSSPASVDAFKELAERLQSIKPP
jgi:flagellum-specific ATP synthase